MIRCIFDILAVFFRLLGGSPLFLVMAIFFDLCKNTGSQYS